MGCLVLFFVVMLVVFCTRKTAYEMRISDWSSDVCSSDLFWYGGDIDKLWIKSQGEGTFGGALESAEVQALWSHAISPWFDLQAGARYDFEPNRSDERRVG